MLTEEQLMQLPAKVQALFVRLESDIMRIVCARLAAIILFILRTSGAVFFSAVNFHNVVRVCFSDLADAQKLSGAVRTLQQTAAGINEHRIIK